MADYPALPLWTDAYLADCSHLSDEEHGIHLRLLMLMWRTPGCRLPDDNEWLARHFSRPIDTILQKYRPIIAEFYQCEKGFFTQKRLSAELAYLRMQSKTNSANAKSGWEKRKKSGKKNKPLENNETYACDRICETDASRIPVRNAPTPTPKYKKISSNEDIKKALEKLSVSDVAEWLARKRAAGEYVDADPQAVLERFCDYCLAHGRRYTDWIAAYRNAFSWQDQNSKKSRGKKDENRPASSPRSSAVRKLQELQREHLAEPAVADLSGAATIRAQ